MFLCLHIPDFAVAAAMRTHPSASAQPCAVLAEQRASVPEEKLPLLAINSLARTAGVKAGWPLNRALIRCPNLTLLPRDVAAESILRHELIYLAECLGPDLEISATDAVTIDLSTRAKPLGEGLDTLELDGASIWHARAATPDLAHLAARHELTMGRIVTAEDLATLPVALLHFFARTPGPMTVLEKMWGLQRLGDFMALPRQALIDRLGPEAGRWHDSLHGKSCRLLRLHRPPESFAQSFDCDDSFTSLDQVIFALKRMLYTLAGRLASRHLAASMLDCRLRLESGETLERRIRLPEPQSQVEGMLAPLQMWLESLKLSAPVTTLELDATATFAASAQREWFGRQMPQPERFTETVAKLEALLGSGRVGIPAHGKSFAVDRCEMLPVLSSESRSPADSANVECPVPMHRFRPPRKIAVAHETRDHKPWPLALLNGPHPGEIVDRRGPFSASGDWWHSDSSWQRLEWDIQLASQHLLRLVFQAPDQWQLDGIYT